MFDTAGLKALLIDVDDTIIRYKPGAKQQNLFDVLQSAGVCIGGLTKEEAARRIEQVRQEICWWHWSDFVVALELNAKQFWRYAQEVEATYLEPTGSEILHALQRLKQAGILLYVTSNNPSSGILHKLGIAGLATIHGAPLFSQLLGATELQAMKWESLYWKKALAHTGLDANEVAVVGDNAHDDYVVPHSIGIPHSFLINRHEDCSKHNSGSVTWVMNFAQIADTVLAVPETSRTASAHGLTSYSPPLPLEPRLQPANAAL